VAPSFGKRGTKYVCCKISSVQSTPKGSIKDVQAGSEYKLCRLNILMKAIHETDVGCVKILYFRKAVGL
jgi:hypothetical protein